MGLRGKGRTKRQTFLASKNPKEVDAYAQNLKRWVDDSQFHQFTAAMSTNMLRHFKYIHGEASLAPPLLLCRRVRKDTLAALMVTLHLSIRSH